MTLTPKQLAEHNAGLGGSDAPKYANLDFDLWREKIGDAPVTVYDPERAYWGRELEPVVRNWLAEKLGREITQLPTQVHPEWHWLIGHLDGVLEDTTPAEGVEVKCADKLYAHEWGEVETDQVPIRHVLQCHHYMLITGIRRFHLAALLGGNSGRHYVIDYDPELARLLLERAKLFWAHVVARKAPTPITLDQVSYLYPSSQESIIKATPRVLEDFNQLTTLRRDEARAARAADEYEVKVKAYMGSAAILADPRGRKLATWRQQDAKRFDFQAFQRDHGDLAAQYRATSSFRVFRLK